MTVPPSHSLDYLGGGRIGLESFLLDFSTAGFGRYVMATVVGLLCTCTHAYVYAHTYMYTCTCACMHVRTHIHTHTHKQKEKGKNPTTRGQETLIKQMCIYAEL